MSNRWDKPDIPHKGWTCADMFDVRADGESVEEANYEACEMCGNERIRFVHLMRHQQHDGELRVGCVCAEKMSGDYQTPKKREQVLRSRAVRRAKWLTRRWKTSRKGHPWLKAGDFHIVVSQENLNPARYRLYINERRGQRTYNSEDAAKLAAFDAIELMKQRKKD